MFILKDNQKNLNEAVSYYFTQLQRIKPQAEPDFRTLTGDETDARRKAPKIQHGRSELRGIWASSGADARSERRIRFSGHCAGVPHPPHREALPQA